MKQTHPPDFGNGCVGCAVGGRIEGQKKQKQKRCTNKLRPPQSSCQQVHSFRFFVVVFWSIFVFHAFHAFHALIFSPFCHNFCIPFTSRLYFIKITEEGSASRHKGRRRTFHLCSCCCKQAFFSALFFFSFCFLHLADAASVATSDGKFIS